MYKYIITTITSIIMLFCIPCSSLYAKEKQGFLDSLEELGVESESMYVIPTKKQKKEEEKIKKTLHIELFPEQQETMLSLANLTTPVPKYQDYLIRELSPAQYEQFYTTMNRAKAIAQKNNFSEAIDLYTKAIAIAPFYYVGYMERGKVLAKFKKNQLAIQDFTTAIRLDKTAPAPFVFRAVVRTEQREYGLTLQDYQTALNLLGNDPILLHKKGEILLLLQDFAGAKNVYSTAIEAKPQMPKLYFQRAIANAGMREYADAIADYSHALRTTLYIQRLLYLRNTIVTALDSKEYPRETQPISILSTPEAIYKENITLLPYNLFVAPSTVPKESPTYPMLRTLITMQQAFPKDTLDAIQKHIENKEYKQALQIVQEYITSTAQYQKNFSAYTFLPFIAYLSYECGEYKEAETAYATFLQKYSNYTFLYINYTITLLKTQSPKAVRIHIANMMKNHSSIDFLRIEAHLALQENLYTTLSKIEEKIVQKDTSPRYQIQLASAYALDGKFSNAIVIIEGLIKRIKDPVWSAQAYFMRGLLEYNKNEMVKASKSFDTAYKLTPSWGIQLYYISSIIEEKKYKEANILIATLLKEYKNDTTKKMDLYTLKGVLEFSRENYLESATAFSSGINTKAEFSTKLYYNKALADSKRAKYAEALQSIEQYNKAYPKDALGYVLSADIKIEMKQVQNALRDYKKAITLQKNLSYAYSHIANAFYMMGMVDKAKEYYSQILGNNINNPQQILLLAIISLQAESVEDAIEYCNKVLELDANNAMAYTLLTMSYMRIGNMEDAYMYSIKSIASTPKDAMPYILQGEIQTIVGEDRKAIESFSKAIIHNAFTTDAYSMRGLLYIYLGDTEKGLLDLEASKRLYTLRKDKNSSTIIQHMIETINTK